MNIIEVLQYVFLGIVQGFTEPIPVSSSGHLMIIKELFNFDMLNDMNFEIVVNFGSFIAIFFLYRKEIFKIITDFFNFIKTKEERYKENYKYAWLIVLATIPAGIFGLLFKDKIEALSGNIKLIGIALLITCLALFLIKDEKGKKEKKDITVLDSIIVGFFQVIALFPGISRSGATIVGATSRNMKRETAVNYSFMLYLPISVATMILGVKDLAGASNLSTLALPYTLGMIASMIVTYFSAKWFINVMKKGKLGYFSLYCLIAGILVILFLEQK
ncbi:MAG TPA: UDP pyrophosphate phosphatase [Candidatus Aphodocola excrementigallinarum]|uniref:Undecaprenyl-diphosphatase n=1 Tax=Candidatus Aphodocola excrementigallinarum TaxID=2840670 RepID=A0A9D1IP44_9FIRM|nr:UDP pyrophosphate phosphatase [Candidatus Aphodocola excrementigallinarum]